MTVRPKIEPLSKGGWDERPIIEGIREGRESAFEALYQAYFDRVHRLCLNMMRDEEQARSATQETFLRALGGMRKFRGDSGLSTWIYRITRNVCLNELSRADRKRTRRVTGGTLERLAGGDGRIDPSESVHRARLMESLLDMLETLDPAKRMAFLLFYVEDRTADEIAEITGEGRGTVLKRLQRVREELVDMAMERGIRLPDGAEPVASEDGHEAC